MLRRLFSPVPTRRPRKARVRPATCFRSRLFLQSLEARDVPATFTVTNANDSGAGSLRQAILDSNNAPGADTIVFDNVAFATPQQITLSSELLITDDLTITGPGASQLSVSGNNANRVFEINLISRVLNVTLSNMTVTGGKITSGSGAGIYTADENVTLNNMVISGNTVAGLVGDSGGGVGVGGGGILTVRNSILSGNSASGHGGGIYFFDSGSLLVDSSTVSGNSSTMAARGGGGIYFYGTAGAGGVVIRNSTITGNSSAGSAGGIAFVNLDGNAQIQNSTITGNTSATTGTLDGTGGGGISVYLTQTARGNSTLTLQSTIVSGNSAANGRTDIAESMTPLPPNNFTATIVADHSAFGVNSGFTLSPLSANNLPFGAMLNLQPLANNGGPTPTMALGPGSAAIDTGSNPANLTSDQRGTGFARVQGNGADIGAFERASNFPTASGTFPNVTTAGGTSYTLQVTYSDSTAINVSTLDSNDIRVTGPNGFNQLATFVSVDNNTNGTPRTATYTITPPGGAWAATANGTYTVSVEQNQVANTSALTVPGAAIGAFQVLLPQTYIVTNTNDSGAGSLRDAITQANNVPNTADTITFGPLFNTPQTIALTSGQLSISDSVTISGPGANLLTVRRDPSLPATTQFRIFSVVSGIGVINVNLTGLTITGGNTAPAAPAGSTSDGAGILLGDENLTLNGVVVTGNTSGSEGGGIGVQGFGGNLIVRNSTISGNTANGTAAAGPAGSGGGIYFANRGSLLLENSTVSGNTSTNGEGGGIYFYGIIGAGGLTVRNSTISGNVSGKGGGGVSLNTVTGQLLVQNSTITANTANGTGAGMGGGGITQSAGTGAVITIVSSIVSGNTNANGPDVFSGGTVNVNFSAVGSATGFTPSGTSGNNLAFGANLLLGPLANNGGPTLTHALGANSPAINAGSNPLNLTTDQRGTGFVRVFGSAADIGAFESQPTAQANVASVGVNTGQANTLQRSSVTSVTVTFDRVVSFVGAQTVAFQLTRISPGSPTGNVTLTVDTSGSTATQTIAKLTFSGSLTDGSATAPSLIDGNYQLTVFSNQIQGGLNGGDNISTLYRYYGDVNGDRVVNGLDLAEFRSAFGTALGNPNYLPYLDQNGDGAINGLDLAVFRTHFGTALSP
jgi:parallel beta-helix repeat protein